MMGGIVADVPAVVSTPVGYEDRGMVAEETSPVISSVDAVSPSASVPDDRTVEVVGSHIAVELCRREHHPQVAVAHAPPCTIDIGAGVDAHEVVEVDFIDSLILCFREAEFVGHLVAEEEGFVACLVVCHCAGRDGYRHHHCQSHHLFHIAFLLRFYLFSFSVAKVSRKDGRRKGMHL